MSKPSIKLKMTNSQQNKFARNLTQQLKRKGLDVDPEGTRQAVRKLQRNLNRS